VSSKYKFSTGMKIAADASLLKQFTIASGADGSAVSAVDLGGNYDLILIKCADCSHIAASTSLSAKVGFAEDDSLCSLYEQDDPSTEWSKGDLPTSGSLAFLLTHATGSRRLQLVLSNAASGGSVVFEILGLHRSV